MYSIFTKKGWSQASMISFSRIWLSMLCWCSRIMSLRIYFTAYSFSLPFFSARKTLPNVPLPTTLRNLKSSSFTVWGPEKLCAFFFDFDGNDGVLYSLLLIFLLDDWNWFANSLTCCPNYMCFFFAEVWGVLTWRSSTKSSKRSSF